MVMFVRWLPLIIMGAMQNGRGHGHRHHNNNRLMELLTAGIVAKVLQKQEGDGGGGHEYYPVPIHLPIHHHHGHGMGMSASESHGHHHHVTEKIIPIPIPHHTTRIIHINADAPHPLRGGGGNKESNSFEHGGGSYDSSSEGQSHHHSGSSPATIKQIFFQDSGIYTSPMQVAPVRHQGFMTYRRPTMGMVPAAAAHPAYLVRSRYPMVAVRPRMPVPYAAASMYAMPYRRVPPPAQAYVNPMMMRRPYPSPVPMPMPAPVPAMW